MTPERVAYEPGEPEPNLTLDGPKAPPMVSAASLALFGWLSALLALFVAAPNFGVLPTIRVVEALLIAIAIISAVRRFDGNRPAPIALALAAFAGMTALSAIVGFAAERADPSPYRSAIFGGTSFGPIQLLIDQIAALAAFALLAANRSPADADMRTRFKFALEATGGCVGFLCALELVHDHSAGARIDAGFGNPNLLASFLVMCFPIFAAGVFSASEVPSLSRRVARALVAVVIAAAVWYSGSRGALLGVGVSVGLLGLAWGIRRGGHMRLGVVAAGLALAVLFGGAMALHHGSAIGGISHTRSDQQRIVVWHAAVRIAEAHPLTGVGLGGFPAAMWNLHMREPNPSTPSGLPLTPAVHLHAHNIFLQYAAERGLPGLCAIVTLVAALLVVTLAPARLRAASAFQLACGIGLIGLAVQNLFDYTLWFAPLLILTWCLAAVASSKPGNSHIFAKNLVFKLAGEPTESP